MAFLKLWLRIAYTVIRVNHCGKFILIAQVYISFSAGMNIKWITLLQRFDVAAGEGDADAMNGDLSLDRCLTSVLESLCAKKQKLKH